MKVRKEKHQTISLSFLQSLFFCSSLSQTLSSNLKDKQRCNILFKSVFFERTIETLRRTALLLNKNLCLSHRSSISHFFYFLFLVHSRSLSLEANLYNSLLEENECLFSKHTFYKSNNVGSFEGLGYDIPDKRCSGERARKKGGENVDVKKLGFLSFFLSFSFFFFFFSFSFFSSFPHHLSIFCSRKSRTHSVSKLEKEKSKK